eukprot:scaffold3226_cov251-Pinguiococcus_pyrenoidosus.AAC.8
MGTKETWNGDWREWSISHASPRKCSLVGCAILACSGSCDARLSRCPLPDSAFPVVRGRGRYRFVGARPLHLHPLEPAPAKNTANT